MKNRLKQNEVIIEITPEMKMALKNYLGKKSIDDLGSDDEIKKTIIYVLKNLDKIGDLPKYKDVANFMGLDPKHFYKQDKSKRKMFQLALKKIKEAGKEKEFKQKYFSDK